MTTHTQMTDQEILARLRQEFRTGWSIVDARSITSGAPGDACTACGAVIGPLDPAPMQYVFATRTLRFHGHCDDLWHEARGGTTPAR